MTPLKIVPGWKGDERYVGDSPQLRQPKPPPPVPEDPSTLEAFGPFAAARRDAPYYSVVYAGLPALDLLVPSQKLVYGYVRGWNENGKPCYASAATIGATVGLSERWVRFIIDELAELKMIRKTPRPGRPAILEARMDA